MAMQWVGRIGSGDEQLDRDLRDLDIVTGPAGSVLYAMTGQDGGLSAYRLQTDGSLARLIDSTHHTVWGMTVGAFDTLDLDGQSQLVLAGTGSGKLIRYRLEDDGRLAKSGKIDLPGPTLQDHVALAGYDLGTGRSALYTVDAQDGTVTGWLSSGTGGLSNQITGIGARLADNGPLILQLAEVGSRAFLLAADSDTQGVRSFRIESDTGALHGTDSVGAADGLGVALPTAMETVTAHGATWVVLAAADSNSLSVMELTTTGGLIPTDHILDTRATRFDGVTALEVVQIGDHVFVLAGGADDGISLFALLPDGQLVHRQTLAQDHGLGLENITGITATQVGDAVQIFVSSGRQAGLTQISLPLAGLGQVIEAGKTPPAGGTTALSGTADSDLLIGRGAQVSLLGQAGDDILVAGVDGGVLTGGLGADLFVLRPTERPLLITDFQAGIDQLDLSHFPMLRSVEQLRLTPTDTGITIGFGSTTIEIVNALGTELGAADLWPTGFITPDRIQLPEMDVPGSLFQGGAEDDILNGGVGNDRMSGGLGADTLFGGSGNDWMAGNFGNDRMSGGAGHDTLFGGLGNDWMAGNLGNDRMAGNEGNDVMFGGLGADTLFGGLGDDRMAGNEDSDRMAGGAGNDTLVGGLGDDWMAGDLGNDRMEGNEGNDRVSGGLGADTLFGGSGNDWMAGNLGNDRMSGGAGHDTLFGGLGTDWMAGNLGNDRMAGNEGNDVMFGGLGADTLFGGVGDDRMAGNEDNDRMSGEAGHDTLFGGSGNDWMAGNLGNDRMDGGTGHDTLFGGLGTDWMAGNLGNDRMAGNEGNDVMFGGLGADTLFGGVGDDRMSGGEGHDTLFGGSGNDWMAGNLGNDRMAGNEGHDTLFGGLGTDWMAGNLGNDRMAGNEGNDVMFGGLGADTLFGGLGDDRMAGNEGNDRMAGGGGADQFLFASRHGNDTITDFTGGVDEILFYIANLTFSDLTIEAEGADVRIHTGEGSILLNDLAPGDLSAADFLFF